MDVSILNSVLDFWFIKEAKNNLWFQKNLKKRNLLDKLIRDKWGNLLLNIENSKDYITKSLTAKEYLAIIICLDQFSRHIYRVTNKEQIKINTIKAQNISKFLIKKIDINKEFTSDELIFLLMPFKHTSIFSNFTIIRNVIDSFTDRNLNLDLFWKDSIKKFYIDNRQTYSLTSFSKKYTIYEISQVCEYFPVFKNVSKEVCDILVDSVKLFINNLDNINIKPIVVSLSGGPDSMVLLDLLVKLKNYHKREICAFHIDYSNRRESDVEKELVSYFCKSINVKLYYYKIKYMKRSEIDRTIYENTSRILRFNLYRKFNSNIVLGHIREDLIENIWTNFARGRDLFKLHKMDEFTNIEEVHICRPFLQVMKKDILLYAQSNNVPYLKNTTPKWSNRGKLRNNFIPETYKQFGKSIDDKILYLSNSLASYKNTLDKLVFKPLFDSIIYIPKGLKLDITSYLDMDLHFWQTILQKLFHNLELSMPSIKSIKQFTTRLNNNNLGKITLKKNVQVKIIKSHNITELYISKI